MSNWQRRPARQGEAPHSSIWEVNGGSGACFPYSPMYLTVSMDPLKSSHWITPVVRPFCIFKVCFGFSREGGRESAKVSDCSSASLPLSCQIDGAAPRMAFARPPLPSENSSETVTLGIVRARPAARRRQILIPHFLPFHPSKRG